MARVDVVHGVDVLDRRRAGQDVHAADLRHVRGQVVLSARQPAHCGPGDHTGVPTPG
jgi:hypothetical protein